MPTQPKPKPPPERTAEIIPFTRSKKAAPPAPPPADDLGRFSRGRGEPDDYTHRQKANAAALVVVLLLVIGGVWLALKLSELRRAQDCVMAGRLDCKQVISPPSIRQ